jgi:haloacid dehalogenase-like hydrolase
MDRESSHTQRPRQKRYWHAARIWRPHQARRLLDPTLMARAAEQMAQDGLRVIAVAYRDWNDPPRDCRPEVVEHDLRLLGLIGLLDPPREEAKAAVSTFQAAGIVPMMITGDHPATARAIARRLGILGDAGSVLTGRELQNLGTKSCGGGQGKPGCTPASIRRRRSALWLPCRVGVRSSR